MSWRWVSIAALLGALVIGFGVLSGGSSESHLMGELPKQPAYYLKDAVITQTDEAGAPSIKLVASTIEQQPNDNSIGLYRVRVN